MSSLPGGSNPGKNIIRGIFTSQLKEGGESKGEQGGTEKSGRKVGGIHPNEVASGCPLRLVELRTVADAFSLTAQNLVTLPL